MAGVARVVRKRRFLLPSPLRFGACSPMRRNVEALEEAEPRRRALPKRSTIGAGTTLGKKPNMDELVKLRQQIAEMEKQA